MDSNCCLTFNDALWNGCANCVRILLYQSANPLHEACRYGKTEIIKILLECGYNVNEKNKYGETPLYEASTRGYNEVIKILLRHMERDSQLQGEFINEKFSQGWTYLHIASHCGHNECVQTLLNYSALRSWATIDQKDNRGKTALHHAAEQGYNECVRTLLNHGANINEKDNKGKTALHHTLRYDMNECLEILLNYSALRSLATIDEKDHKGRTALHLASKRKLEDEVSRTTRDERIQAFFSQFSWQDTETENLSTEKDHTEETPLYDASNNTCENCIKTLLNYGAKIDIKDYKNRTCLDIANDKKKLLINKYLEYNTQIKEPDQN
jgi:ankyrin repeat protein